MVHRRGGKTRGTNPTREDLRFAEMLETGGVKEVQREESVDTGEQRDLQNGLFAVKEFSDVGWSGASTALSWPRSVGKGASWFDRETCERASLAG
jgi:hypothetical protein